MFYGANDTVYNGKMFIVAIVKLRIPMAYRYFLLERMGNCDNAEEKWENVVPHMMEGDYTIEHIMPQTLSSTWRQQLGDEAGRIHSQYLHVFANLTLAGYNSIYGNRPFADASSGMESEVALIIRRLCVCSVWSSNKVTTKMY